MKMKKAKTALLAGALLLSVLLTACGGEPEDIPAAPGRGLVAGLDAETEAVETDVPETENPADHENPLDFSDVSLPAADAETGKAASYLMLPENSAVRSDMLALQALLLCTGNSAEGTALILENAGFRVLEQVHFDKAPDDPGHTCAFTVAEKTVFYQGEERTLLLAAVRGTAGGEWYSNFDFAPSQREGADSADGVFAENFLFAAEDVFLTLDTYAQKKERPLFLLCGHSRGAACANLLGVLANAAYGAENVFTYTFATPATVRGETGVPEDNIFNYINPLDLVPYLPLETWGFGRAGTDILLPGNAEKEARYREGMEMLHRIAPTVTDYYTTRHSLTDAGISETGLTAFEVFTGIGKVLAGAGTDSETTGGASSVTDTLSEDSDFYPLYEWISMLTENNAEKGKAVLMQHLPDVYAALIQAAGAASGMRLG